MKLVIGTQFLISALSTALFLVPGLTHQAISFIVGSLVILLSVIMMAIGFNLIFRKKLIALAIGIIVFKYAILGIIIYTIVRLPWFNSMWFAWGIASFIFSGIIYSLNEAIREGKEHVI